MEGATFALRNGFGALQRAGMRCDTIRLIGGGSQSAAWRQMAADVFDLPVAVTDQTEGAAFGAALQALWALDHASGGKAEIAALAREHVRCAYREPYQRFLRHLQSAQQFYANH